MAMDRVLLEILACPVCKGELQYHETDEELICRADRLAFPVIEQIPAMLVSRARHLSE